MNDKKEQLKEFFEGEKSSLDCYLIEDIKTLLDLPSKKCGGCGYPLLMTVFSGSELMGKLLIGVTNKEKAFEHFVTNYMPEYSSVVKQLYQAGRHFLAHYFIPGYQLFLANEGKEIEMIEGKLYINMSMLGRSFIDAYEKAKNDIFATDYKVNQTHCNLQEMISKMGKKDHLFENQEPSLSNPSATTTISGMYTIDKFSDKRNSLASISPVRGKLEKLE